MQIMNEMIISPALLGSLKIAKNYFSFADIDSSYTNDTLFSTVYSTMVDNSILLTTVTANSVDYPASGTLEIVKLNNNNGVCRLYAANDTYSINITPDNVNQIIGS